MTDNIYTLVRSGDTDPLTHPLRFIEYMQGAFEDCAQEQSLWLISMNPKCRPIARTLLRAGPLAAAMATPRDLFRVALHADANAIAIIWGEPSLDVSLTAHDQRALKRFGESAGWLSIEFVDYLVLSTGTKLPGPLFRSRRQARL